MGLREYRKKRDFQKTREPAGAGKSSPGLYVIQKHDASRLHYDFRLEWEGVLKSWAVPKGPSRNPFEKRLAVQVEDHPIEYGAFEGTIPKGEYGGGIVMLWDRGTWEPEGDTARGLRDGKLTFQLHGEKLKGLWTLARMGGQGDGKNWLLIKKQDARALKDGAKDITEAQTKSVVSGRGLEEIAKGKAEWSGKRSVKENARQLNLGTKSPKPAKSATRPDASALEGARRGPMPTAIHPELCVLRKEPPAGDKWIHEVKFDGYRLLAFLKKGKARLFTRNEKDWTRKFNEIAAAFEALDLGEAIFDGEACVMKEGGLTDFQALQNTLRGDSHEPRVFYAFDLLYLEGYNLLRSPLEQRKELLRDLLKSAPKTSPLRFSEHVQGRSDEVFANACRLRLEGLISKRLDSGYTQKRSTDWVKSKCHGRQEFVIGGFTKPSGARSGFGALLIGVHDADGKELTFAGKVGTGFDEKMLRDLLARMRGLIIDRQPFKGPLPREALQGATWVKPELVCEIEFTEWTRDGRLRHPSFQGLREDKRAREVRREMTPDEKKAGTPAVSKKTAARARVESAETTVAGITLSHPDKILYPDQGLTKEDVARYYESVSGLILPFLKHRAVSLVRCPHGATGECFYQKHLTESSPPALRGVSIEDSKGKNEYILIDDLKGLISLVQLGVLEFHPWGSREDGVENPDIITFDLDPGEGVTNPQLIAGARELRKILEERGLKSFVKTSGGKGFHVVVPLQRRAGWEDVKSFARAIAGSLVMARPDAYIATASKAKRGGKIFIDYLRNSRGATSVAPYSTRARSGAPVSMPIPWEELTPKMRPDRFTATNALKHIKSRKQDPWKDFFRTRQTLGKKELAGIGR